MAGFLIDANLPYRFALWQGSEYTHVFDLDDSWPDSEIWQYAKAEGLTIVTKDADFSTRAMVSQPPPRVIHLRIGNLRMRDFHKLLQQIWPQVLVLNATHRLLTVYPDRIEGIR